MTPGRGHTPSWGPRAQDWTGLPPKSVRHRTLRKTKGLRSRGGGPRGAARGGGGEPGPGGVCARPATARHPGVTAEGEETAGTAARTPHHKGPCFRLEVMLLALPQTCLQVANNGQSVPGFKVIIYY